MIGRLSIVLVVVATLLLPVSAGARGAGEGKIPKDVLVMGSATPVSSLDPSVNYAGDNRYLWNVYESLVVASPPGSKELYRPSLAKSWTISADGLEYTFAMQEGVSFHDGAAFNAEAAKKSIDRTRKLNTGPAWVYWVVESIEVKGEMTLVIRVKFPVDLLGILAGSWGAYILSPKVIDMGEPAAQKWLEEGHAAGTGPYMLTSYKPDEEIQMQRFEGYWRGWKRSQTPINRVLIKLVKESAVMKQMLESGEADEVSYVPVEDYAAIDASPDTQLVVLPSYDSINIYLNTQKPPLDNKLVRQAISWAVPYKEVIELAVGGSKYADQARGLLPPVQWSFKKDLFQYKQDLAKAKQLMVEAGYPNGVDRELLLTYSATNDMEKRSVELIKESLAKIGVKIQIQPINFSQQWAKAAGPVEQQQDLCYLMTWAGMADPYENFSSMLHSEEKFSFNFSYWKNKQFDELIDKAYKLTVTDPKQALELYGKAQDITVVEAPAIWLFNPKRIIPMSEHLKGDGQQWHPLYNWVDFYWHMWKTR